jgi:RHS repeat-associated protein
MPRRLVSWCLPLLTLLLLPAVAAAQTATSLDARVQAPQLSAPERGSLAGQYARTAFGPADVSRGGFQLPAPLAAPSERGALLADVFPSYSPDAGLSEWGMGWQSTLAITRWRALGAVDYATDERTGPWGRLARGADGHWYAAGLSPAVRLEEAGDALVAYLPDGSRWTFGGADRTVTARGTYAWYLSEVVNPLGRKTRLVWEANATGRRFLTQALYGGTGDAFQARVDLTYEPLPVPLRDLRSGQDVQLDRRVRTVQVLGRNAQSGAWEERWRYLLTHEGEGLGPAYFLTAVEQLFASGERAPATRYTYRRAAAHLAAAPLQRVPELDAVLATYRTDALQPHRSAPLDADQDGRLDLEWAQDHTLLVQGEDGFTAQALPPAPAGASPDCRRAPSLANEPRLLATLKASDRAPLVVSLKPQASRTQTALTVCDRPGGVLATQVLPGDWVPGPLVRLADLDGDQRPELVRVGYGRYQLLPNTSPEKGYGFGPPVQGTLLPAFTPDTAWVHDFNGDGLGDLIARTSGGLTVWLGRGDYTFETQGRSFQLRQGGALVTGLSAFQLNFTDVNRDGLTDVLLTSTSTGKTLVFANSGTAFVQTAAPALASLSSGATRPVVGDFSGSGNTEVTYVDGGLAKSLAVDAAGTSLLESADDGKGTVLRFEYARGPAEPGVRKRQALLSALQVESSGDDTVRSTYAYAGHVLHQVGYFLVGYPTVTRTGPGLVEESRFSHSDHWAGLLTSSTRHDTRSPGLHAYAYRTYEERLFQGLPWRRLKEEGSGYSQEDGRSVGERVEYAAYAAEVCAARLVRHTAFGRLTVEAQRAQPPSLAGHLHCLVGGTRLTGTHVDPALDFQNEVRLTHNAQGLVERVEDVSPGGEVLTLQEVAYRPDSLIDSIHTPGRGVTRFGWQPGTLQLVRVASPDGVSVEATRLHPVTGAVLALTTRRGARSYTESFAFDGLERLHKRWDDLGGASEQQPNLLLAYRYATATRPGSITSTVLMDAATATVSTGVEWQTAAGEGVARGARIPEGWTVEGLTTRSSALLESRAHARAPLGAGVDPASVDYASLLAGADVVGVLSRSGLGFEGATLQRLHADVQRQLDTRLSVEGGWLREEATENGAHSRRRWLDAQRRPVASDDEAGSRYLYGYDALGRLRSVTLPGGRRHTVRFDGNGRLARVDREGVASVTYAYQAGTGLLEGKRFLTPAGAPVREESYAYDAIGRRTRVTHRDVASGRTRAYRSYYDGATPAEPARADAPGLLTAVEGEGYVKLLEYRVDGKPTRRVLQLAGWRSVEAQLAYRDDGSLRAETTCVRTPAGGAPACTELVNAQDRYGRPDTLTLDGQLLSDLSYDGEGRASGAWLTGGSAVSLRYDSLTRALAGFSLATPSFTSGSSWRHDARGLIGTETLEVGGRALTRAHGYSAQRFLTSSRDADAAYAYAYGTDGLPSRIEENGAARTLVESDGALLAGGVLHTFDGLGRTVQRGDLALAYGPDGQLARATRGTQSWDYLYDENGRRLLKLQGGVPLAAYLEDGGYLDATGLTRPLKLGGRLVGVIQGGAFRPLAADMRGTVLSDYDGTARMASPYGARTTRPASSAALDYVEKGYDAELGLVRMGVRDYDPSVNRFTTPDPLFLESPERCVQSGVECNLYSYAANDPVAKTDPNGTCVDGCVISAPAVGIALVGMTFAVYLMTPPGQRSLRGALEHSAEAISNIVQQVKGFPELKPEPEPGPKPQPTIDIFPPLPERERAPVHGHHTVAVKLMELMRDRGAMTPALYDQLKEYGRRELLYVPRPVHEGIHKALSAFLLDRYPELGKMRNGYQHGKDWQRYVDHLESLGYKGQALQDRILEDHRDFYRTQPAYSPTEVPSVKFGMEEQNFKNAGPVK